MHSQCRFSNVTKDYLNTFHCILNEMIQGMTSAELSDSISYNFIVQMIPHHRAAIEMSKNILKYTTSVPLQDIASNIITSQTKSIKDMEAVICSCKELTNCERDLCLYQRRVDQIMRTMFEAMGTAPSVNDINRNFMCEMIPHHKGAIEMSKNALRYDICPQLKPILDSIITSQQEGILKMERLLRCMCC